mmetsp:Transcript_9492/g.20004  ORF Transcript_9492/g.20004 Transcript_9492/m.20004 type:complete len:97 (-) Transcript_9492:69-359(-)
MRIVPPFPVGDSDDLGMTLYGRKLRCDISVASSSSYGLKVRSSSPPGGTRSTWSSSMAGVGALANMVIFGFPPYPFRDSTAILPILNYCYSSLRPY